MTVPTVPGAFRPDSDLTGDSQSHMARSARRHLAQAYQISWLDAATGTAHDDTVIAPVLPMIEAACACLVRGVLVATEDGPVAVEDLLPGMMVTTTDHGPLPLQWVGSFDPVRLDTDQADGPAFYRIVADAFGPAKPDQDTLLAPRAHLMLRHPGCQPLFGVDAAFGPVRAFEDGATVIPVTPISIATVFNIAFDRQATILANGLEIESFHPGPHGSRLMDDTTLHAMMRLFPQVRSLEDFGPQRIERLTQFEVRNLQDWV